MLQHLLSAYIISLLKAHSQSLLHSLKQEAFWTQQDQIKSVFFPSYHLHEMLSDEPWLGFPIYPCILKIG